MTSFFVTKMLSWIVSFIFSVASVKSLLLAVVVALTLYWLMQKRKYKLPPGPFALPLIGNYELYSNKMQHRELLKLREKYGPVIRIYVGPSMWIYLNDIKVTLEALVKRGADFADRPFVPSLDLQTQGGKDIALGRYGPTWKLHRKIAGKALRQYLVGKHMEETVQNACQIVFDVMCKEKAAFDPAKHCDLLVFNIFCAVCFGKSYDLDDEEFVRIMKIDNEIFKRSFLGMPEDFLPAIGRFWHSQSYKELKNLATELQSILAAKLKNHMDTFDKDNIRDFTDNLILARKEAEQDDDKELLSQLTETHLLQTLNDIFFGGINTIRATINWSILHMAAFPDIQTQVQDELDKVVGKNRFPELKDREYLTYTEATLHESMRMNTAATIGIPHLTRCDTTVGGYDIPKGTTIMINHWALLHDPDFWEDVDRFNPHRFLDSDGKLSPTPESWLPFSAGRRVCLGESVAKPELFQIFATLLQKFRFNLPPGKLTKLKEDEMYFGLFPKKYKIIIEERY